MSGNEITTVEAMRISGFSRQWIYALITAGRIKSTRVANVHLAHRDSLIKYIRVGEGRRKKKEQ